MVEHSDGWACTVSILISIYTFNSWEISLIYSSQSLLLELGTGWAPAVADDVVELEFIQEQEQISSDDRSYWIGGLGYETLESQGSSGGKKAK